jgi:hypothetical protein
MEIHFSGAAPFPNARAPREALSLIRRLIRTAGLATGAPAPAAVRLETLTASRSAAQVFKVTPLPRHAGDSAGQPLVVKIAPVIECEAERGRYGRYGRALPAALRPQLLAAARGGALGGLCYEYVGGHDGGGRETLTDALQRGDPAALALALGAVTTATRDVWRGSHLVRAEGDIARRYLHRHFTGWRAAARAEAALFGCAARYFGASRAGGRWLIGPAAFPPPFATLFAGGRKLPYLSAIVHGDLNSDNILLAPILRAQGRAGVTLVDFRNSGRGHVVEDLIALEASIRINWPPGAGFGEILEGERLIALGQRRGDDPYESAIATIRAAAADFGQGRDDLTYHFAVAAVGLRLMQAVDLSDIARARITAAALWAVKALAGEALE